MRGLHLALSWLTILPLAPPDVDGRSCRNAISWAPVVGTLIGAFGALVLWAAVGLGLPALVAGSLTVGVLVVVTRGMHVDGLADTVDGLGCYGPPERALSVMRDGGAGPFAVVALVLVLGMQAGSLAALASSGRWPVVVLACATGRAAFVLCCRNGIPAARPEGMGSLVAGSQPNWLVGAWWATALVAGVFAVPGAWWLGSAGVLIAAAASLAFAAHIRRRFGGVTGDVLGAASELATTVVLVVGALTK